MSSICKEATRQDSRCQNLYPPSFSVARLNRDVSVHRSCHDITSNARSPNLSVLFVALLAIATVPKTRGQRRSGVHPGTRAPERKTDQLTETSDRTEVPCGSARVYLRTLGPIPTPTSSRVSLKLGMSETPTSRCRDEVPPPPFDFECGE